MAFYDKQQYEGEWTFLFEENLIPLFQRRGYHQAYFHSLMANYTRSQPVVSDGRFPVVILGNSLALPDEQVRDFWERWKGRDRLIEYLRKAEAALSEFDAQLSYFRYVEEDPIPQLENGEEEYAVFRYLLAQSSTVRRIQILERLAPLGLHVFGSGWERSLSPNSPIRACLRGYYPMQEEFRVFAQGTIFINIHTPCNDTGPNMRFFNVPGMGAFQISDCPHFDRYFKSGSEMIYCSTLQEFEDSTRYYLAHPQERDTLRFAAHQKVAENWTYDHWIDRIFPTLRKGYSFPLLGS